MFLEINYVFGVVRHNVQHTALLGCTIEEIAIFDNCLKCSNNKVNKKAITCKFIPKYMMNVSYFDCSHGQYKVLDVLLHSEWTALFR